MMAKTEKPTVTDPNGEDTEETIVTEPLREDEVLMLGNTFKRACLLNWLHLVTSEENYSWLEKDLLCDLLFLGLR